MRWFLGRSARDREHLVQTLRSLGPTSVAGLSAALSWSERRTERVLQDALVQGDRALRFDPARRTVAWGISEAPALATVAAAPATSAPASPPTPAPVLPKSWGAASARCPSCQVAYLPTGTDAHLYCPQCGRLAAVRSGAQRPIEPPASPSRADTPTAAAGSVSLGPDRRSQELFAAWVTAQPIQCPKCRTPLRHHGVAEYACPGCGARVAFERSAGVPASTRPAAPAAVGAAVAPPAR